MNHTTYSPSDELKKNAHINSSSYQSMYQQSIINPVGFWREHGQRIQWYKNYTKVRKISFDEHFVDIKWFYDGTTNASYNCLDRHLEKKGDQVAIIWEPDSHGESKSITYRELHKQVCQFSNALKSQGVRQGDVVIIYMPMLIESVIAMLACSRVGAIHSVVFGGFSPESLAGRIIDSSAKVIITADEGLRAGKKIPLKDNVDDALTHPNVKTIEKVIVYKNTNTKINWYSKRDVSWQDITSVASPHCEAREMNAEAPLFILYTSGSTGQPKGIVHSTGGYLVYASMTFEYIFDYKENDIYWCNADIGWITGHSYVVYGPLLNGATIVLHEGTPVYPSTNRLSQIIDKHQVNILYTAPTAIRTLMSKGEESIQDTNRNSLRLLGSVGEPINPEAWYWYYNKMGQQTCPIVDTWWQTETGGIMISPLAGVSTLKPGSANRPFFGIQPALVDNTGLLIENEGAGNLVILDSWPGQARTIFGNHGRFIQTYFSSFKGMYQTGDGAKRDADGDYWITGRVDDVLNVSGHRLGTAEIESAMVAHPAVAESAAVGVPHKIKGESIYVYVTLNDNYTESPQLYNELIQWICREIGVIARPDYIQWTEDLPKTRSGKIMRRILRKIASNDYDNLGDLSTLADPNIVEKLITNYRLQHSSAH